MSRKARTGSIPASGTIDRSRSREAPLDLPEKQAASANRGDRDFTPLNQKWEIHSPF
jgi:hypothetical protein